MADPADGATPAADDSVAASPPLPGAATAAPPDPPPVTAVDPALERERWLREQIERAQRRPSPALPADEHGLVLHPSQSGLARLWRWLIDDFRSARRAAAAPPEDGILMPLWQRLRVTLPRLAPRRRRRRRRRR